MSYHPMTRFPACALILAFFSGCQGGTGTTALAAAATGSLPATTVLAAGGLTVAGAATDGFLTRFFKLQCWRGEGSGREVHMCPPGVAEIPENRFDGMTLLGLIAGVDDYGPDVIASSERTSCGAVDAHEGTVTAASFVSNETGGNGAKLVLDTFAQYQCKGRREFDGAYYAYNKATDDQHYFMIRTRKNVMGGGFNNTDVMQMYLETTASDVLDDSSKYAFLAFNSASSSPGNRHLLLMNLQTHRFMVKTRSISSGGQAWLVAAGTGGIDPATHQLRTGTYTAIVDDGAGASHTYCVNNADTSDANPTDCADSDTTAGAWSGKTASFLGMTAGQQSDLAAFLAHFADAQPLSAADLPDAANSTRDFPDDIR
jgi:hypothetical protein